MHHVDETASRPIGSWDVSAVTSIKICSIMSRNSMPISRMEHVVGDDHVRHDVSVQFNRPLGNWDVQGATIRTCSRSQVDSRSRTGTYRVCTTWAQCSTATAGTFNRPIGNWDVSKVTSMQNMFSNQALFNIHGWMGRVEPSNNGTNVSKRSVQSASDSGTSQRSPTCIVYSKAVPRSISLGRWDVSNVNEMGYNFQGAQAFNQPLGDWDVSSVRGSKCVRRSRCVHLRRRLGSHKPDLRHGYFHGRHRVEHHLYLRG